MSDPIVIESLDLAALMCSRVCHDVISPVGAIVNGLEVLEEENDESMKAFALDLIRKSAKQASARLQFCRLAFGAAGSAGASIDMGDAHNVARGFIADDKTQLNWNVPRLLLPKNRVKMLLNLLLIAVQTIPRGGSINIEPIGEGEGMGFKLSMQGLNARIPPAIPALLAGENSGHGVDAHAIQPIYTGMLARDAGIALAIAMEGDTVVLSATPV